ncbi:Uncharacterised protein [Mycobacteroides abscessus subsp. abscessus]|nr:Uncharacterised protein [Mycobacteroides abscessus subsp. abscessus]
MYDSGVYEKWAEQNKALISRMGITQCRFSSPATPSTDTITSHNRTKNSVQMDPSHTPGYGTSAGVSSMSK